MESTILFIVAFVIGFAVRWASTSDWSLPQVNEGIGVNKSPATPAPISVGPLVPPSVEKTVWFDFSLLSPTTTGSYSVKLDNDEELTLRWSSYIQKWYSIDKGVNGEINNVTHFRLE